MASATSNSKVGQEDEDEGFRRNLDAGQGVEDVMQRRHRKGLVRPQRHHQPQRQADQREEDRIRQAQPRRQRGQQAHQRQQADKAENDEADRSHETQAAFRAETSYPPL